MARPIFQRHNISMFDMAGALARLLANKQAPKDHWRMGRDGVDLLLSGGGDEGVPAGGRVAGGRMTKRERGAAACVRWMV